MTSASELDVKRIRRGWEPESKAWHDDALACPWEDVSPSLHKATIFALKNVFFFSHATPVQARAVPTFAAEGHSVVVEAPTGSGKSLAFLIPLMERVVRYCERHIELTGRPLLTRSILGVVVSPTRSLAEQTYVVARNLACRLPYSIRFALCDGVVSTAESVLNGIEKAPKGAGTFLITTPGDLEAFMAALQSRRQSRASPPWPTASSLPSSPSFAALFADQPPEVQQRYLEKLKREGKTLESVLTNDSRDRESVTLASETALRFVLIIDEADMVLRSTDMSRAMARFVSEYSEMTGVAVSAAPAVEAEPCAVGKKRKRRVAATASPPCRASSPPPLDVGLFGATAQSSDHVVRYAEKWAELGRSSLEVIALGTTHDFATQLQNRFVICEAHQYLSVLVHLINMHTSKKHFVFFRSYRTLLFMRKLLEALSEGVRPLLHVKKLFVMYEEQKESTRLQEYNAFLQYKATPAGPATGPSGAAEAVRSGAAYDGKPQHFKGGSKRPGRPGMGSGALLLCTDIAAYGLDVRDVDYIYHFETPATVTSYIHRTGRVGRMGMRGSSVLIIPCVLDRSATENSRERKTTSTRFNTATNTKRATGDLQGIEATPDDLTPAQQQYLDSLSGVVTLEVLRMPPLAPISAAIRSCIARDPALTKLARSAAMSLCSIAAVGDAPLALTPPTRTSTAEEPPPSCTAAQRQRSASAASVIDGQKATTTQTPAMADELRDQHALPHPPELPSHVGMMTPRLALQCLLLD